MRPKLFKSFSVVVAFWLVASTLWWSFQKPAVNLEALAQLKLLLPFLPFSVPAEAGILSSLGVQWKVLVYWSAPVGLLTMMSCAVGYGLLWLKAQRTSERRDEREVGNGEFRGVTVTLGDLPTPKALPRDPIELSAADDESLARLTERELKLLNDIFGTISAHPGAFAGDGVLATLLDHALNIASKALNSPRKAGLAAIVAAAYEMGKITAYKQNKEGQWELAKSQDKEAARILGMLDSWFALPTQERLAVMMAVKFHSNPKFLPEIDSDPAIYALARELLATSEVTATAVVVQEKQKTLDSTRDLTGQELPDVIFDALLRALPALSFQSRGLPKGVAAVAWKVGSRVYLLEIKLRETVLNKLPGEVRGALLPNPKERSRLQPFTVELLKALDARGWLVKKINDVKVETKDAIWNIKAGKLDFKGVIVVDVPEEYMTQLPADDSMYDIAVTGPLFTQNSGGMQVSKQDLMGSVLKPPSADKSGALESTPATSNPKD